MKKQYDIAIIGGGIGGLMTAHRLAEKAPELSICLRPDGRVAPFGTSALPFGRAV